MRSNIKQVYIPYWEWEDWQAGMWRTVGKDEETKMLKQAITFTGDHVRYGEAMMEVVFKWENTMINSLTNPSINKRAFVGHCACQYKIGIPEYIIRKAWKHLTKKQRILADHQAEIAIKAWTLEYMRKSQAILKHGKKDAIKAEYQMRLQLK